MTKLEALQSIFEVENIQQRLEAYSKTIEYSTLLSVLSKQEYNLLELGTSSTTITRTFKNLWPERIANSGKICNYLFTKYELKYCSNCAQVKELEDFSKNKARATGLNSHCRSCELETRRDYQRFYQAGMRAKKLDRTPPWASIDKIKEIFKNCPEGYHVDHIIPLQGELVSGLHVETNLQYLPAKENLQKQNKFIDQQYIYTCVNVKAEAALTTKGITCLSNTKPYVLITGEDFKSTSSQVIVTILKLKQYADIKI